MQREAISSIALLKSAGFRRHWLRRVWINPTARKLFAFDVVRRCECDWLSAQLSETVPAGEFWFYPDAPSQDLNDCFKVLRALDRVWLQPVVRDCARNAAAAGSGHFPVRSGT